MHGTFRIQISNQITTPNDPFIMKKIFLLFLFFASSLLSFSQKTQVYGVLQDETGMLIPYVSVSYANNTKGTTSNDEGEFVIQVSEQEKQDHLLINCLGFETFKIKIQDFIDQKIKNIILKESAISLNEVELLKPDVYVTNALKSLKKNTISSRHQLTLLYRRASSEENKARFFVEHYLKIYDRGPISEKMTAIEVLEARKSADYRFFKKKEVRHSVYPMTIRNPIRHLTSVKRIKCTKIGDSSYEGEEVIIIKVYPKKQASFKLFIGLDTYKIYKIENLANNSIFIYKNNNQGKLQLAYHSRQWKSMETIPKDLQKRLNKPEAKISATYKHEVFVLSVETNKKKMKVRDQADAWTTDMADLKIPYHENFWKNFVAPPDTKYFKKIKKELESNFGVPLETQFKLVN